MISSLISFLAFLFFCSNYVEAQVCATDGSDWYVSVELTTDNRLITSSDCPHYDWTDQNVPDSPEIKNTVKSVPRQPVVCTEPTAYVGAFLDIEKTERVTLDFLVMEEIGVAFNGIFIYGNADADGEDAYVTESDTFDQCNGHASPQNAYHYHSEIPESCLFEPVASDAHSSLFAIMADGIPLYGPLADNGLVPTDLDECNGHVDETYPFYHYHVTADFEYPYTVNCLKGEINPEEWSNFPSVSPCEPSAVQYDYSTLDDAFMYETVESSMTTPIP